MPAFGAVFPPICCKCGATHGLAARPISFTEPLGLQRTRASANIPICEACNRRWAIGALVAPLLLFMPLLLTLTFPLAVGWLTNDAISFVFAASFALVFPILGLVLHRMTVNNLHLRATELDAQRVKVRGVSRELLRVLPRC
jgi:hypothetical protein